MSAGNDKDQRIIALCMYIDHLQQMVEWYETYMKKHKETSIHQHEIMNFDTAKSKGVFIEKLRSDMSELAGRIQEL
tara:strand:- start:206 stop:433 length:228 start_codon:yes stop_codon:yes gene_type:complete